MNPDTPLLRLPSEGLGSDSWTLRLEAAGSLTEAAIGRIGHMVHLLAKVASHGGFPAARCAPPSARMEIGPAHLEARNILVFDVDGSGCDLRGFELLRGMAERLVRNDVRIEAIALESKSMAQGGRLQLEPTDDTEYEAYPALSGLIRFPLAREPLDDTKSRRALVDLVTPVRKNEVDRLDEWLRPWFQLLEAGAFALPVGLPSETESIAGATTLFDEQAIEVSINRFQASECAWNVLANMIDACWPDARWVSQLTIE
jgi:hypothetical protein